MVVCCHTNHGFPCRDDPTQSCEPNLPTLDLPGEMCFLAVSLDHIPRDGTKNVGRFIGDLFTRLKMVIYWDLTTINEKNDGDLPSGYD